MRGPCGKCHGHTQNLEVRGYARIIVVVMVIVHVVMLC
jgi:hypothetical protein